MQRLFTTDRGQPVSAVTAEEAARLMHLADKQAVPGAREIIESGGRSTYWKVRRILTTSDRPDDPLLFVIGTGYIGAIGLAAARHLANHGTSVTVCRPLPTYQPEHQVQWASIASSGITVVAGMGDVPRLPALVVDAFSHTDVIGHDWRTISRPVNDLHAVGVPVLALEPPLGVDPTTGIAAPDAIRADYTLCMAFPKTGLQAEECGAPAVADVGIPPGAYRKIAIIAYPCFFAGDFVLELQRLT